MGIRGPLRLRVLLHALLLAATTAGALGLKSPPLPKHPSPKGPAPRPSQHKKPPPSPRPSPSPPKRRPASPPPRQPKAPRPPSPIRTRNGLRLVRGGGTIGRLEVYLVSDGWQQGGYPENGGWAPVCNDGTFDDARAKEFCKMLGEPFGRKFYGDGVSTFGEDELQRPTPVGSVRCSPLSTNSTQQQQGFPLPIGRVALPYRYDKKCLVSYSDCPRGELVALQCSDYHLAKAKPPPPSPPAPPPSPPPAASMQDAINLLPLESNLWDQLDGGYIWSPLDLSRVELLVNASSASSASSAPSDGRSGSPVWAPLCAPNPPDNKAPAALEKWYLGIIAVANISCRQFYDFLVPPGVVNGMYGGPVPIPLTAASDSGDSGGSIGDKLDTFGVDFNPGRYGHWVTVVGGASAGLRAVHQMLLQVTTEPCASGMIFTLNCQIQA